MVWPFSRSDASVYLPGPTPEKEDDPPQYVPVADFNRALDDVKSLGSKLDQFTGMMTGFLGNSSPGLTAPRVDTPPQEVTIEDITDEQYADAVLRGDAPLIQKRTRAEIARAERTMRKEYDTRFKTLEQQGMSILDQVSSEIGQQSLAGMPYYQILKAEIDTQLKTIPAHQRTPEMRQWVYERTVGANITKIREFDRTEEMRIARDRDAVDVPGRSRDGKGVQPTGSTVFGEEILSPTATVRGGGQLWANRTPEEWVRNRYGTKDVNEAAILVTNVMALDNCHQCFGPIIGGKCHCRRGAM